MDLIGNLVKIGNGPAAVTGDNAVYTTDCNAVGKVW